MFKDKISIDGAVRTFKTALKGLISSKVPGYRFYVSKDTPVSKLELLKLRSIPFLVSDKLASWIGSKLIGRRVNVFGYHNIVPTVSRAQLCKALTGNITTVSEILLTHQELGTGTSSPANGDTNLETPDAGTKKTISSLSYVDNQINITSFWAANEATGTWREFGTFINSTVLFNRIAINITVASGDALVLDGTVLIS